jgi:DNA-binding NarL/FixJ family response regulator
VRTQRFDTVVIGPSALLREGLARVLGNGNFRIIASATRVHDIASRSKHPPVLLLIDSSDDSDATVAQITLFKQQYPTARVAVLSDHHGLNEMVSAFRAGANLCFAKCIACDAFLKALDLVMLGQTILPPELLTLIADHGTEDARRAVDGRAADRGNGSNGGNGPLYSGVEESAHLSSREKCILRCIVGGDSNKRIARTIGIAEATVKVHVKAILRKIRVHNRTQAAIWALNNFSSLWPSEPCPPSERSDASPPVAPSEPVDASELHGPYSRVEELSLPARREQVAKPLLAKMRLPTRSAVS